jgi:very-short-patch-repair endonuclease
MRQRVSNQKRGFAKSLRQRSTLAEHTLWRQLRGRRFADTKFRRQVPIGPWIVDFVSFEYRLIVEADGGQHNESKTDARRDDDLAARGFRVLRFWNNDVLARSQGVLERLYDVIANSPSPGFAPYGAQPPSPTRGEGKRPYDNG